MRPVDAVLHVRRAAQHLEAVQASRRNPQRGELLVVQHHRDVASEGRRRGARVHHDVQHRAGGDPHELGLAVAQPAVQPAQHAGFRTRLGVLGAGAEHHLVARPDGRVEGAGEQAPGVAVRLGNESQHPVDVGLVYVHHPIMPEVWHG